MDNEILDSESLGDESLDNESLGNESLDNESLGDESLDNESLGNESLDNESLGNESLGNESLDDENRGERVPTETETEGTQKQVRLEAVPTSDGRLVVPAEGSVWQLYFPAGKTPTEDQMRVAVGALGAVATMRAGSLAHTTWDASVDGSVSEIVDFAGRSVIDPAVRAEAVDKATRADAFDERVESEVRRIVGERIAELELSANEQVAEFERAAAEADRRAQAAEQQLTVALEQASEKSVLPEPTAPATVEDVGEIIVEPDIDFTTSTVRGEERKA